MLENTEVRIKICTPLCSKWYSR